MYSSIRLEIEFSLSYDEECLEVLDTPSNLWACSDIQATSNKIILISQPGDPYAHQIHFMIAILILNSAVYLSLRRSDDKF